MVLQYKYLQMSLSLNYVIVLFSTSLIITLEKSKMQQFLKINM